MLPNSFSFLSALDLTLKSGCVSAVSSYYMALPPDRTFRWFQVTKDVKSANVMYFRNWTRRWLRLNNCQNCLVGWVDSVTAEQLFCFKIADLGHTSKELISLEREKGAARVCSKTIILFQCPNYPTDRTFPNFHRSTSFIQFRNVDWLILRLWNCKMLCRANCPGCQQFLLLSIFCNTFFFIEIELEGGGLQSPMSHTNFFFSFFQERKHILDAIIILCIYAVRFRPENAQSTK